MNTRLHISLVVLATCCLQTAAFAQTEPVMRGDGPAPKAQPFRIERLDPALDDIIAPTARPETLASGFGLTEGPLWIDDPDGGYLIVAGLLDNVLYKITPDKQVSVYIENAGYTGDDVNNVGTQTRSGRSHVLLIGPSCASRDPRGRLVWCADNDLRIMRLEEGGARTVVVDNYRGKRFSGPNDLTIKSNGDIYFTDNDFGLRGAGESPLKEMPNGVWLVRDGKPARLLDRDALGGTPNGIALSEDEKFLYLSAGRVLKRYELLPDGTLGKNSVFSEGPGIGDGIKVDRNGNVFSSGGAGPGIIRIMARDGTHLGTLHLPIYGGEPKKQICATNVGFGGPDAKSLFVTACDVVYRIPLKVRGIVPGSSAHRPRD